MHHWAQGFRLWLLPAFRFPREPPRVDAAGLIDSAGPWTERKRLMGSKRQQTFAKMERERKVKERRALKQEKKQAAAAERSAQAADSTLSLDIADQNEDG